MKRLVLALALVASLAGCVSSEVKDAIGTAASVGTGNVHDWWKLTDDQRAEAYWKQVRFAHDLNLAINGVALPKEFEIDAGKLSATDPKPWDRK